MGYTKQNFIKGQILKADHLNAMETGIEANDAAVAALSKEMVKSVNGVEPDENGNVAISGDSIVIDSTLTISGAAADAKAVGEAVSQLSEEIDAIKNEGTFEIEGNYVKFKPRSGSALNVTSRLSTPSTTKTKHYLHQVNSRNLVDFSTLCGGAGKTYEKNGLTATVNDDGTLSVTGSHTQSGFTNIIDKSVGDAFGMYCFPAGTYTTSMNLSIKAYKADEFTGLGNKKGTFTIDEPFRIIGFFIAFAGMKDIDETVPLVMVRGGYLPDEDFVYSGKKYTATLPQNYSEGVIDWTAGMLYDHDGNYIDAVTIEPPSITGMPGENYMWTGDETVYVSGDLPSEDETASNVFDPTVFGLPVLTLDGECGTMTKDVYVDLAYTFMGMSGTLQCKKQGSSSINTGIQIGSKFDLDVGGLFNFTLKFPEAFEAKEGWGAQTKYCFKANAIDHTHSRNVVSCKLWGKIVKSRSTVPAELANLPNGGAIDGFPIVIVLNGKFYCVGTFNIPKDGWMFGSPKAILCADKHVAATQFKGLAVLGGEDFEVEYVEDENNTDWLLPSINAAIQAVIDSDGSDLDTTVSQHIDIPSAMDYYIHAVAENATDAVDKNYILVTFDGVKWYFSDYDRDTVYGLSYDGTKFLSAAGGLTFASFASTHGMMELIYNNKRAALKTRTEELFSGILSEANVCNDFTNFIAGIPAEVLAQNCKRWPLLRSTSAANLAQLMNWYRMRRAYLDPIIDSWTD